jgi:hypothetical protein
MKLNKSNQHTEVPVLPEGFSWGQDISPESMENGRIAIDPHGRPTTFIGYLDMNQRDDAFLYAVCVGGYSPQRRKSYQFVELHGGALTCAGFLTDNHPYKILKGYRLHLPRGADNSFGVINADGELDEPLTRTLFGATYDELDDFIDCFHTATRYTCEKLWNWKPARITFSKSRDNNCDLSGVHIPANFPFITLSPDTQYFGGHISLYGLYRQIALLCHYSKRSDGTIKGEAFFQRLVDCGAKSETIVQLHDAAFATYSQVLRNPKDMLLALRHSEARRKPFF